MRHAHFDTVSAEADGVAAMIAERIQAGARPRDFAILVRSNADADPFLRALNVQGLPHRFSGSRGLYAREEVRLLVSFLRVLANPDDSVSLFYLVASEVYGMPEGDLLRLNHYARRKTRPLLEVLRGLPENEDLASVSGKSRDAAARLLADLERATGEVPRRRTGEVLYGFLQWSGLLGRLAKESSAEAEAKVRNIARFFEVVKAYGDVAEHDRVPAFVAHLDLLREAGDDPAVAEADLDEDAVHVLTVHKAKGLEFPHVFLVGCAESKFPLQRRGDPLALPEELVKEEMTGRRQRPPPGGAAALLRRHDPGPRRAGAHLRQRLRHLARAQGLALRGRGARPAVAEAPVPEDLGPRGPRAERARPRASAPGRGRRSPRTSCCGCPTARSTTTRPAPSSTATSTSCACPC